MIALRQYAATILLALAIAGAVKLVLDGFFWLVGG